ncbi:MAG: CDP-alcohol phosphatidyltransferase family protein [bacterium]
MKNLTKARGRKLLKPLIDFFAVTGVPPTVVTITAIPLSILAALLFASGNFFLAGWLVLLIGLCDTIDGELSRRTGQASPTGAFIDSTVDRFSEGLIFAGIGLYYLTRDRWGLLATFLALIFSYLVSYARARAEGVGKECQVGLFERPIRVLVMVLGALVLGKRLFFWSIVTIALGSLTTFIHRVLFVLRQHR